MHIKSEVVLFFLVLGISSICLFSAGKGIAADEKEAKTSIYMNPENSTLTLTTDRFGQSVGNKIEKIYFNNKDYTEFATELLEKYPMTFASCNLLIFGEDKVVITGEELTCRQGILFIPQNDAVLIIQVSDIDYDESTKIIKGNDARWKKITANGKQVEEKKLEKLALNLSPPSGVTIYMDSLHDTLTVTGQGRDDIGGEIRKIVFNSKDYTEYAESLLSSQPLCFASCRMLIFGKEKTELIKEQWKCAEGIIFIPGEKEILIVNAAGISFNETSRILKIEKARVVKLSLDMKYKEEREEQNMTVDFSKR